MDNALSENERKIYGLVCARYTLQFMPDHEYQETTVEFEAAGERFKTSGRTVLTPGWKGTGESIGSDDLSGVESSSPLPVVAAGESGPVIPRVEEKTTAPPKRFTYDGLLAAMNNIHLYVEDPAVRKQLKELDGIGTSATQESIVGTLFERRYIEKKKKQILSTPIGQALIGALSASEASKKSAALVSPGLTALWEQKMTQVEKGELELDVFVSEVAAMVEEIVKAPLAVPEISGATRKKKCLTKGCDGYLRHIAKGKESFFACPACGHTFKNRDEEPIERRQTADGEKAEKVEADCPLGCGKKARRLEGAYGFFWKCACSPESAFKDVDDRPAVKEERPKTQCPVKSCKGTAEQYRTQDGSRLFWKCETCRNTFNDAGGKPVIGEKTGKGYAAKKKAALSAV
jgi:DNA topoisomerase-3